MQKLAILLLFLTCSIKTVGMEASHDRRQHLTIEEILKAPNHPEAGIVSLAWSPDNNYLAAGTWSNDILVWSREDSYTPPKILKSTTMRPNALCWSIDSQKLLCIVAANRVQEWNLEKFPQDPEIREAENITHFWTKDGQMAAFPVINQIYLIKDLVLYEILNGHTQRVTDVAWSSDNTKLASASYDKTVRIWNITNLKEKPIVLEGHTDTVEALAWLPNRNKLASGSADTTIRIWNINKKEKEPEVLSGHTKRVFVLACSADGKKLASGSFDNTVRIWSYTKHHKLNKKKKAVLTKVTRQEKLSKKDLKTYEAFPEKILKKISPQAKEFVELTKIAYDLD